MQSQDKRQLRKSRHKRVRARVSGTVGRPRLSIFRSNKYIWAQLIDDDSGITLVMASDKELKTRAKGASRGEKTGELIAKKALEKNIARAVFDRGGYKYHGLVKAVAEGARKGGLKI